ncbi:glycosyltransferase family 4 protein [Sulfitobacter aestuariivivens]|uniref:Glycosyltransferase family 4 protein n=1 Tax=Sulfitobacter aestuariivivens TaxID=2766981 RepID=A0A927HGG1_9RHOB|nr:glycosyltransferase family 4 protein [Sulfitobacter aestuariivivens]MBD3665439.1 glycosyltransferase family 4 protein [Sulfitobacter aestuariivivens]
MKSNTRAEDGKRRIAVVGPMPPSKSGIARHTASVAQALEARGDAEVRVWSFYRQYPRLLFPGEAEESEDFAQNLALSTRTIGGTAPLSWHRTIREIAAFGPNDLVMPAWTFFLAPALGCIARALRRRGSRCTMIVHNVSDHEGAAWKDRLMTYQLVQADQFLTHNAALRDTLQAQFPGRPVHVFPHPVFSDYPEPTGALARDWPLELLFFGLVRPYKGLDILIDAFALSGRTDARLTIVGEFWAGLKDTRDKIAALRVKDRIELVPRFVGDAEAAEFFARADAVVLPYRSVTGSGVIPTAYRYGRAVVASDLPGLADVVDHGKTGWLVPSGDVEALASCIRNLERTQAGHAGNRARAYGETLTWERFVVPVWR